ncbi:pyridoxal phosphate-dependent aminotransferase [Nitrospina gracilis]|uniref:pyridoxal phosphate-dependent aminotransferase n=1 Tax=Nitrospina gracilis TaxID=35801 RepID=UPI001F42A232|nr:threonine-phosphate decarboxylase [Nitrospina gracilis]MCF8721649.1 threonine-phosphate decarboxylase [Nitrospina gracilis Nb-211]
MNHHFSHSGFSRRKEPADAGTCARSNPVTYFLPEHGGALPPFWKNHRHDGPWLDFSTSIHPWGPSERVCEAIGGALAQVHRYPDVSAADFKRALGETLSVSESQLMVGNGATELIHLLPHLIPHGRDVLIVEPFFSEFKKAFRVHGIPVHTLVCKGETHFTPSAEDLLTCIDTNPSIGAVVLGHPNSPAGQLCPRDAFVRLARVCEEKRILLIVDESFIDFCEPEVSILPEYVRHPHLICIRSMTKFYGLPGLRLGFAVMPPNQARRLSEFQPPWSVNGLAQAAGVAAVGDRAFAEKARKFIREQTRDLFEALSALPGVEAFPSHANFILFRLVHATEPLALKLYYRLLEKGILIRNCANFEGLDASYFRASVRLPQENRMLVARLNECLEELRESEP